MAAAAAVQPDIVRLCEPWAAQASWTLLDTDFGAAETFLALWQHWRGHALRPALLHYVGILSDVRARQLAALGGGELADALARACYALDAGFHRVLLDQGQVSLTLCVSDGDGQGDQLLARQAMQADSVLLEADALHRDKWQIKTLARSCRRGAQLLFRGSAPADTGLWTDAGFQFAADRPLAVYEPRWQLRRERRDEAAKSPAPASSYPEQGAPHCAVIGAGMAGASVARALAVRGFAVDVYDAQEQPAAGASGLPVGLVVPHHSADDSPRSRMSRQGTRLMLAHAGRFLQTGQDWSCSGVLELDVAPAGLAHGETQGLWHPHAAWIKPARLVEAWLDHPGIRFHGGSPVHSLESQQGQWTLYRANGEILGQAAQVVFANAHGCVEVLARLAGGAPSALPEGFAWVADMLAKLQAMQELHGTLSLGACPAVPQSGEDALPGHPVNGHGSFVAGVPGKQGPRWYSGSTFQTDAAVHGDLAQEHAANLRKLQSLLPAVAQQLAGQFERKEVMAWQGSRCVTHDRLPLVGPLQEAEFPSLWLCAGMGARGLSFSALCAELLAASMCGEPLPLENNLARLLGTRRPHRARGAAARPARV